MPVSNNKRLSFVNFPIPFDHPYTIPTLIATVGASAFLYYSLQASHKADLKEAIRQQVVHRRKHLKRKQEKFASLKIENQYVNPFNEWKQPSISFVDSILYWFGINNNNQIPKIEQVSADTHTEIEGQIYWLVYKDLIDTLPMTKPDFNHNNTSLTWLGQSTCLITVDGLKILTDPVFEHAKRLRPPPCSLRDIGEIDIILVSHQHFDHLDEKVVEQIGDSATWYIPLGLREWFIKKGIENVIELDWWQEMHHKGHSGIVIASVPAMHTSHKEESLWCSFVIKSQSERIFFWWDEVANKRCVYRLTLFNYTVVTQATFLNYSNLYETSIPHSLWPPCLLAHLNLKPCWNHSIWHLKRQSRHTLIWDHPEFPLAFTGAPLWNPMNLIYRLSSSYLIYMVK